MKLLPETKLEMWIHNQGIEQVSQEIGVAQGTVYRWLRGENPRDKNKLHICQISGLNLQDLWDHISHFRKGTAVL